MRKCILFCLHGLCICMSAWSRKRLAWVRMVVRAICSEATLRSIGCSALSDHIAFLPCYHFSLAYNAASSSEELRSRGAVRLSIASVRLCSTEHAITVRGVKAELFIAAQQSCALLLLCGRQLVELSQHLDSYMAEMDAVSGGSLPSRVIYACSGVD